MRYLPPDAYDRTGAWSVTTDEQPTSSWTLKRLALLGAIKGVSWGAWYALGARSPIKSKLSYLNMGIGNLRWENIRTGPITTGDVFLNALKAVEEESPLSLGRTFGLTEMLSPYILGKRAELHIPLSVVGKQRSYYEAVIGRTLRAHEWAGGMQLSGGKLYGIGAEGERTELLPYARARLARWHPDPAQTRGLQYPPMYGRLSDAYQETLARARGMGSQTLISHTEDFPFHIIGSRRASAGLHIKGVPWRHFLRETQSVAEMWSRRFFRLMDSPLELAEEMGSHLQDIPALQKIGGLLEKAHLTNRFGLGGEYEGNLIQQWGRWLRPGFNKFGKFRPGALLTFIGAPFLYKAADEILRGSDLTKGTSLEHGISGAAANVWQKLMLGRARFGQATGLTTMARAQERIAPGSTDFGTMVGLPLAGAIGGSMAAFFYTRLKRSGGLVDVWERIRVPSESFTGTLGKVFGGSYTKVGKWGRIGLVGGLIAEAPFLFGAAARLLGGIKTPEELSRIYTGEEEIPVMKGRWWEFGSSFYRGTKPDYYRPHWTVLAKSNYMEEALFRGDESAWFKAAKQTPILSDIIDPYYLERLHYYDRPYPTTGPSKPGLAILGSLYAGTIGRLFKPEAIMHEEEWRTPEGRAIAQREEHAPIPELGGLAPLEPESGYSPKRTIAETISRSAEAIGLPGWFMRLATGSDEWGADRLEIQSAELMTSERRRYWDMNLGGLMGSTEWYRRVNPQQRGNIRTQQYNPLENQMPSWLPGGDDYFIDFHSGDPYVKIAQGEARLPGPGYAALHPELKGVRPEDYPLGTRLKILADVAPYSTETQNYLRIVQSMANEKQIDPEEHRQFIELKRKLSSVKKRKEFVEREDWSERNILARGPGRYWEFLTHDLDALATAETLLPLRPIGKFIHQRSAIEDYERTQVFGTDQGFWNRPWANFIRPAIERTDFLLGDERIPEHIEELRDTEEYFDKLKYLKASMHARYAELAGDIDTAKQWQAVSRKTITGLTPFGSQENYLSVMSALPKRERDYFTEFSSETDPEMQERILKRVPGNVGRVYRLLWENNLLRQLREEEASDLGIEMTKKRADMENALQVDVATDGRLSDEMLERYREEGQGANLREWLMEQELQSYFAEHPLPSPGSIIWDPRVDTEDVKLKLVQSQGQDMHDYDLWESRERTMDRKPYLNNVVEELQEDRSPEEIRRQIHAICTGYGIENLRVDVTPGSKEATLDLVNDADQWISRRLEIIDHANNIPIRSAQLPARHQPKRKPNQRPL